MKIYNKKENGQSIVLAMFLMLVAAASTIVLYNTAQVATEKTRLVNASDAAAYSGAVWTSRQLNFMAYTNRAMIANHIMVGHLVSYVSWMRYVDEATDNVADTLRALELITIIVPPISRVIGVLRRAADFVADAASYMRQFTETMARIFVPGVDGLNRLLGVVQNAAWANMQAPIGEGALSSPLHQIMHKSAQFHVNTDDNVTQDAIRVNSPSDAELSLQGLQIIRNVTTEFHDIATFTKKYQATNSSDNRMKFLVENSYGPSEDWLNNRQWRYRIAWVIKLTKQGKSEQTLGNYSDWEASDRLDFKFFDDGKWEGIKIGEGSATAREFSGDYVGVPDYYDLHSLAPSNSNLMITAYTTMPIQQARLKNLMGMGATDVARLTSISRASVYHRRPTIHVANLVERNKKYTEYTNLYNPFWQASMVKPL